MVNLLSLRDFMVLPERFELSASPLPRECSTPELRQRIRGRARSITEAAAFFNAHCGASRRGGRRFWTRPPPCAMEAAMPSRDATEKPPERRKAGGKADRLAEALRANLAKRKAQKRAREAAKDVGRD